jgi:hypothetical protein
MSKRQYAVGDEEDDMPKKHKMAVGDDDEMPRQRRLLSDEELCMIYTTKRKKIKDMHAFIMTGKFVPDDLSYLKTLMDQNLTVTYYPTYVNALTGRIAEFDQFGVCFTREGFITTNYQHQNRHDTTFRISDGISEWPGYRTDLSKFPAAQMQVFFPKFTYTFFADGPTVGSGLITKIHILFAAYMQTRLMKQICLPNTDVPKLIIPLTYHCFGNIVGSVQCGIGLDNTAYMRKNSDTAVLTVGLFVGAIVVLKRFMSKYRNKMVEQTKILQYETARVIVIGNNDPASMYEHAENHIERLQEYAVCHNSSSAQERHRDRLERERLRTEDDNNIFDPLSIFQT